MPEMVIHDVEPMKDCLDDDYAAMELLYYTDAYENLLNAHFNSQTVYHPKTMRFLSQDSEGAHRRMVMLWNARFMSPE